MKKSKEKRIKKRIKKFMKKRMKHYWGPRCKDYSVLCGCCKARDKYDALFGASQLDV